MNDNLFNNQTDLAQALYSLKYQILNELKVASIGIVREIQENKIKVELFPYLENEKQQFVYTETAVEIKENDIIIVLFMDRNFIQNLSQIKNNNKTTKLKENMDLHSLKYGIIVANLTTLNKNS